MTSESDEIHNEHVRTTNSLNESHPLAESHSSHSHTQASFPALLRQTSNARREARSIYNSSSMKDLLGTSSPHQNLSTLKKDLLFIRMTLTESFILSSLLTFIPIGIIVSSDLFKQYFSLENCDSLIFITNFIAIIPLAWLLGTATEELAQRTSMTLGGLLNATFGNAVELIVSVAALKNGMIRLVQTSLLGSILANLLLVLGMSFAVGGFVHTHLTYNKTSAHVFTSMLLLACIAMAIPSCYNNAQTLLKMNSPSSIAHLLLVSRLTAVVIFFMYILYLIFQLHTHAHIFADEDDEDTTNDSDVEDHSESAPINQTNTFQNGMGGLYGSHNGLTSSSKSEKDEEIHLSLVGSILMLFIVTLAVAVCSELLVDSIHGVVTNWGVPESFIGLVLLPIVGNAAEHATAVTVAIKNKLDLSIGVAVGSSTQIALFLVPFITILGWIMDKPMNLDFPTFEIVVLVMSVLIVKFIVSSGESNWLEGCMLMGSYIIIGIAFYFQETSDLPNTIAQP